MTVDERLADWLERTTPEPPHPIAVSDIATRVRHRRRPWLPLLAAACVVLVAAVTIIIASRSTKHDATPPAHRTTTHASPSPRTTTSTTRTLPPGLPIRPWDARIVRSTPALICPCDLTSDGRSLYATVNVGARNILFRVNPYSGETAAQFATYEGMDVDAGPTFTDGRLWLGLIWRDTVTVRGLDPISLATRESLPSVQLADRDTIHLSASGTTVFLAVGQQVTEFDTRTGAITRQFSIGPHRVEAIAAFGSRLYVATRFGAVGGALYTYDAGSGEVVNSDTSMAAISALTATPSGLWITESTGNSTTIDFKQRVVVRAGGGVEPTVGVFGATAWLTGIGEIKCADASTGEVRAQAVTQTREVTEVFRQLVVASGRVFGMADDSPSAYAYLVELHPPAACR